MESNSKTPAFMYLVCFGCQLGMVRSTKMGTSWACTECKTEETVDPLYPCEGPSRDIPYNPADPEDSLSPKPT